MSLMKFSEFPYNRPDKDAVCRQIREISFPEGLEEIGEYAFHKCHAITELIFPNTMTQVGAFAFLYCDHLKKVIMEGPEKLGKAVFSHNLSLQEVHLNQRVDDSNFSDEAQAIFNSLLIEFLE